ncbi:DUF6059 family protein [Kribbella sp. NPDC050470]|uniref:DUF6059 family protein n=1 Tax=unclassified Kribbella TaxID=2644121 RepID=UPI003789CF17
MRRRLLELLARYGESLLAVSVIAPACWPADDGSPPGHPERPAGHLPLTPEEVALWSQILTPQGGWLARTGPDSAVPGRLRSERRLDQG